MAETSTTLASPLLHLRGSRDHPLIEGHGYPEPDPRFTLPHAGAPDPKAPTRAIARALRECAPEGLVLIAGKGQIHPVTRPLSVLVSPGPQRRAGPCHVQTLVCS